MCSACSGNYQDPDMTAEGGKPQPGEGCEVCGAGFICEHGLCDNTGTPWTKGCKASYGPDGYQCQECAEAAHERMLSEYYGGDTPQTDREREEVARQR